MTMLPCMESINSPATTNTVLLRTVLNTLLTKVQDQIQAFCLRVILILVSKKMKSFFWEYDVEKEHNSYQCQESSSIEE